MRWENMHQRGPGFSLLGGGEMVGGGGDELDILDFGVSNVFQIAPHFIPYSLSQVLLS
jgi:hypothetical protein